MEKYSKWRDPKSGIHPFIDTKPKKTQNFIYKLLNGLNLFVIGPILSIVRLLLILVVLCWFLISYIISLVLSPVKYIRRPFDIFSTMIGARTILLLLGFFWIDVKTVNKRRQSSASVFTGNYIKNGDLIICNHISYVEILYLAYRFAPTFTKSSTTWNNESSGLLTQMGLFSAIIHTLNQKSVKDEDEKVKPISLDKILKYSKQNLKGPVIVFLEGTTTNGKIFLQSLPILEESRDIDQNSVHLIGFKTNWNKFSPAFVCGSSFKHIFRLCSQFSNQLIVRFVDKQDTPKNIKNKQEYSLKLWETLSSFINLRIASLDSKKKHGEGEFLEYWNVQNK